MDPTLPGKMLFEKLAAGSKSNIVTTQITLGHHVLAV